MKSPVFGRDFTLAAGLAMQDNQIKLWSKLLKPEIADRLHQEAVKHNQQLPRDATGYDVWRGSSMLDFLASLKG